MPDLLLELFSEEIPARMQARAADDLRTLVTNGLVEAGLVYEGAKAFATPRRLALTVQGLPARSPDLREEKKGPRVGAPEQAIAGFLKGAGLSDLSQARVVADKKGDFYVADIARPGRPAEAIIAEVVTRTIETFPWPKSMRWGTGSLRWVRPLHSIVCTFGPETEEPVVVPVEVGGIVSGDTTFGHRFLAPEPIRVRRFDDYLASLERAKVVLDPARRADIILHDARDLAFASGLELVEDEGLLAEVSGLVEWPVVLMGGFDAAFLNVPDEVIRATIRANQKCFVLRDPKTGKLANRFLLVSNMAASDGGKTIVAGNERVIRARLSDAKFFYEQDLKEPLWSQLPKLDSITFHELLGTQAERVRRISELSKEIALIVGANIDHSFSSALLAKTDLTTGMVSEFPELQGLMGRYYATAQNEPADVAIAIEEHYKPVGSLDRVPKAPVSVTLALSDKLDTLVGFWAINEKPTGSKDPYALRRAALGIISIIIENSLRIQLGPLIEKAYLGYFSQNRHAPFMTMEKREDFVRFATEYSPEIERRSDISVFVRGRLTQSFELEDDARKRPVVKLSVLKPDLLAFFADRLKVQLRDQGARHDLVDAVFALGGQDDLVLVVRRVEALGAFLATEDGANLLAGYRRAVNILKAEEKKGTSVAGAVDSARLVEPAEARLAEVVEGATTRARSAVASEDFAGAMTALAALRGPVDAFFEAVLVNAEDEALRANRLALLARIRDACHEVADFSRIAG